MLHCTFFFQSRDISFLYDTAKVEDKPMPIPPVGDKSAPRKDAMDRQTSRGRRGREQMELPDSIIPKEFHLVQSKAALGLEYNKEWVAFYSAGRGEVCNNTVHI